MCSVDFRPDEKAPRSPPGAKFTHTRREEKPPAALAVLARRRRRRSSLGVRDMAVRRQRQPENAADRPEIRRHPIAGQGLIPQFPLRQHQGSRLNRKPRSRRRSAREDVVAKRESPIVEIIPDTRPREVGGARRPAANRVAPSEAARVLAPK
jgi:hypothetical protein